MIGTTAYDMNRIHHSFPTRRSSDLAVIDQSRRAVQQGEQVVARSREVVEESRKVSLVVQMNIVKDPIYSDNPALLENRKSTRLNSSHSQNSYAVFCLKKKNTITISL